MSRRKPSGPGTRSLAGLVASVIVVMLSVAVINEVLERRRRERWSVLAQFVMLELVRNARLIWTGVLAQVGLLAPDAARPDSVDANRRIVRDTPRLTAAVGDGDRRRCRRRGLRDEIALLAAHSDEVLGRWAAVHAQRRRLRRGHRPSRRARQRHQLADRPVGQRRPARGPSPPSPRGSSPAVQIEGQIAGDELAKRIVVITQLAEELDRTTLDLALRVVSLEWWEARLGATVPSDGRTP